MVATEGYGVLSTNSAMYPGHPAAATVALAADSEGRPVFSFSNLSNHASDVARDGRVSLSVVRGTLAAPDEPRVNLVGRIRRLAPDEEPAARELYMQVHPEAWCASFSTFNPLTPFLLLSLSLIDFRCLPPPHLPQVDQVRLCTFHLLSKNRPHV
jgi:putative heme iron utilization protein